MKLAVLKAVCVLMTTLVALQAQAAGSMTTLNGLNLKIVGGIIKSNCSTKNPQFCESTSEISILPSYRKQIHKKALSGADNLETDLYNYDLHRIYKSVTLKMGYVGRDTQYIAGGANHAAIEYVPAMGMNFLFVHNAYIEESESFGPVERMQVKCAANEKREILCQFPNNRGYLKFIVD